MNKVLIAGAGKIGRCIAALLAQNKSYQLYLTDLNLDSLELKQLLEACPKINTTILDVSDQQALENYLIQHKITAVVSSLPYFLTLPVALAARAVNAHYFDLTEDTEITKEIKVIAQNASTAFVPQCGLAPGFISIAAHDLIQEFDSCHRAQLRVGALPERSNHALQYALTWSTDGLINIYGNPCEAIDHGQRVLLKPLERLESIQIDGTSYEAFNTSGGLGSMAELYAGKIQSLDYKTIRYPGHCEKIRFLMNDLCLNDDRETLKKILERSVPKTLQDLVLVYIRVEGMKAGERLEKSYFKKIRPIVLNELHWSAIQISTSAALCAVLELVLHAKPSMKGFVIQEQFHLQDFLATTFGQYYS
jgi:saccharopine dehydrogenase-like NADP-dependent oxidoreductase